jgi:hypothetical protein
MSSRKKRNAPPTMPVGARKPDAPPDDSFIAWINKVKGRIAAVAGLTAAVLGLLFTFVEKGPQLADKVAGWFSKKAAVAESCVVVKAPTFQPVRLSEWDETKFVLEGQNNCSLRQGVYVTFQRSSANGPLVRPPRFDKEGCDRKEPVTRTECWTQKIPLAKGPWEITVPLPPLERLRNPAPVELILLTVELRDLENPHKLPDWSHVASIEQRNDL